MKCSRCKEDKPEDQFHNNKRQSRGKTHYCIPCHSDYMAGIYQRTKDKRKKYLEDNAEAVAERKRSYYLRSTFGITIEEYETMCDRQANRCAICGEKESVPDPKNPSVIRRLAVDHNHASGKVRALLCQRCNMGLGYFRDNPELLNWAANYLLRHR